MSYAGKTPTFNSVKVDNLLIDDNVVYFGDKDTDGSFRIFKDGGSLKIEVRSGGAWVAKDVINP